MKSCIQRAEEGKPKTKTPAFQKKKTGQKRNNNKMRQAWLKLRFAKKIQTEEEKQNQTGNLSVGIDIESQITKEKKNIKDI